MKLFSEERKEKAKDSTGKAFGTVRTGFGRTRHKLLAATGRAEETVDLESRYLEDTFEEHRELLDELKGDAERYLKAAQEFAALQRKLADEVLELYEPSASMYNAGLQYQTGAIEIEKHMKAVATKWKDDFQTPLEDYLAQYDELAKRLEIRDNRRVDMDRFFREYVQALEQPSHDARRVVAKKITYEESRDAYVALNKELIDDMRKLYADRLSFLAPLFAQMVHAQSELLTETQNCLKAVTPLLSKRSPTAPDIKGSVITDDDHSAAAGGTDYTAFAPLDLAVSDPTAAEAAEEEDEADVRAAAQAAAARKAGGRVVDDAPAAAAVAASKAKQATPVPSVPTKKSGGGANDVIAVGLYDFDGDVDEGELPFKKGDRLTIISKEGGDWWEAELNSARGDVPANYLKELK
jgi:hypothetical protein